MPKEIPVLYSPDMVKAVLDLKKDTTRRANGFGVINENPDDWEYSRFYGGHAKFTEKGNALNEKYINSPYGEPGDLLWVREQHYLYGQWKYDGLTKSKKKLKRKFVEDISGDTEVLFSDKMIVRGTEFNLDVRSNNYDLPGWFKRLGRFMFKKHSRIWLEVVSIHAERLQDISEESARAEGVQQGIFREGPNTNKGEFQLELNNSASYIDGFKYVWVTINGRDSWDKNPWVWVIKFKVLSTTGKPKQ